MRYFFLFFILVSILTFSGVVHAQPTSSQNAQPIVFLKNPIKATSLIDALKAFVDVIVTIFIPIIALALVYSGYQFISARGNTEKLEAAKRTFVFTSVGTAILLGAWGITEIISATITAITK